MNPTEDFSPERRSFVKSSCTICLISGLMPGLVFDLKASETGKHIAVCGIRCDQCDAYINTQSGDMEALAKVAREWSEAFNHEMTTESILCDGCQTVDGELADYCEYACKLRKCARERGIETCGHCEDYMCEELSAFLDRFNSPMFDVSDMKANLDRIHQEAFGPEG